VNRASLLGATIAAFAVAGCGHGAGEPSPLRGYRILITTHDSVSEYLARALATRGFTVRRQVRGGAPPTAALVLFTFRELNGSPETRLEARLADTRTGNVVAAVSVALDSTGQGAARRAEALADSLAARLRVPVPR